MKNLKVSSRETFIRQQKVICARRYAHIKNSIKNGLHPNEFSFPIGIQFELTSQCNMYCKHCYNNSYMQRKSRMTITDWKGLVNNIIEHGGIFQCILSGGEPLLMGDDLYEIMDPLDADGTGFVIITNGYLVDKKVVEHFCKYKWFWVQVSIDHLIPEKHDEFRCKNGSWEKAVEAAYLFSSAGLPLRIAHTVIPNSIDYLPDFAELTYQLGASALMCGEVLLSGRVNDNRELLMSDTDYDRFYDIINELKKIYNGRMEIIASQAEVIGARFQQKIPNSSVIIRPDGNVRLDCTVPFIIGNIFENSFYDIWRKNGSTCWNNEKVDKYIYDLENKGYKIDHINHITPDILL